MSKLTAMTTLPLLILLAMAGILPTEVTSFASPNGDKGWKTRPKSAIIQQTIEDRSNSKTKKEDSTSTGRKPWDGIRFIKQSSKFITLPNPFDRRSGSSSVMTVVPGDTIWQSGMEPSSLFQWAPLDDVVMGGVSASTFDNETGDWVGTVSDSNSGGFIGIRTTPASVSALNMEACSGVELFLRSGNAKRIKAVIRDSAEFNGVCWTTCFNMPSTSKINIFSSFTKKDETVSIRIPFEAQVPTIFSKTVPDQTFNVKNVVAFQLVYSKFEFDGVLNSNFELGDFSLGIVDIKAY